MKRSEMIEKMTRVMLNPVTSFYLTEKEAKILLENMEDAGMLPPKHYKVPESEMEEPSQPGYHGLNGWEKES